MQQRFLTKLLLSGIFLGSFLSAFSQPRLPDSLKKQSQRNDSAGIEAYRLMSLQIQATRPDSALFYAQKGLDLAQKIGFKKGEADCLNRLGVVFWKNGRYDKALAFLLNSLQIRESIGDELGMLKSQSDIGIVYADQSDNRTALSYHFRAKSIAEKIGDKRRLGIILSNIGNCYIKLNKVDSALNYEMQAYTTQQTMRDTATMANTLSILGDIHFKLGHADLALDYYRISLRYAQKNDDKTSMADSYNSIARLYMASAKADSSIFYASEAVETAKAASYPEGVLNASNILSEVYKGKNEHLELLYLKEALAAKDSLFNAERIKQIQTLSFNEAVRQEEIAEEKQHAEEERIINLQLIAIAVFIPVFFLSLLFLNRSRTHRKVIDFMSVLSLLLFFEFVNLLIHPFVLKVSNHTPVLELIILVAIAAILAPLHHRLTNKLRDKLAHTSHPKKVSEKEHDPGEAEHQTN